MKKREIFPIVGIVVGVSLVVGLFFSTFNNLRRVEEASRVRIFEASILSTEMLQRGELQCPQQNQFTPPLIVLRIKLDREVPIWSMNGTGEGSYSNSDLVDLRIDTREIIEKLPTKTVTATAFRYSRSFLSICDQQTIPLISTLSVE